MSHPTLLELLRTDFPLIQAPMAGSQGYELAAAVSNAGGLGSLPCALLTLDAMRSELTALQERTSKPYSVNFFCHAQPPRDVERESAWRARLAPYYDELRLAPVNPASDAGRLSFNEEAADVLSDFKPPVVSFHFGLPNATLIARVKSWGATVLSSATTLDEALWLESHGVDVIIAQGFEAGGHRGMFLSEDVSTQVGTLALVRQLAQAIDLPIVAAGGLADARGAAAAIALGAAGVQIGTAYLLCPEARTSAVHRAALKSPAARYTALTNVFTGRPARGIVNRLMRELGPMSAQAPTFPLAASAVAPLRVAAEREALGDFSPLWAGQNTTGCKEVSALELTRELADGL